MPYLNAQQRKQLADELSQMKFNQATGRLRRLDSKSRLVFYRNAQSVGRWMTRYDLPTLGARVTLIENHRDESKDGKLKSKFEFVEVEVEPLPGNNS